ncbi:uncharacterized protein SRS1_10337 [Sporisorium reilianum f. sp. reilianum]|uniref:Uncharacterized protein n=1 Tax=Sporisorium reilianum f. sp. reilianum TaxID=72559 RepID=A0A2N8U8F4_9BASI|nr:uncharacterized protein SRS1_10337 [Sporisorium reilianum f. sp. reilianum]
MFGSPDDTSCVGTVDDEDDSYMPTISDSDMVRDAKRVHWLPMPILTDTATVNPSLPSRSIDSLIEPDGTSAKSSKGLRNVKAKMKAVARFLSASKGREVAGGAEGVSAKGIPIAGRAVPEIVVTPMSEVGREQRPVMRVDAPRPVKEVGVQVGSRGADEDWAAIVSLKERLAGQPLSRPPPPPQLAMPKQMDLPYAAPPPISLPPMAVTAKKRYGNGPEAGVGMARPELPRTRTATPHPAHPSPVRVVSRPLPPTPAALPARSTSLRLAEQPQQSQQSQHPQHPQSTRSNQPQGLGLSDLIRPAKAPSDSSDRTIADTHNDDANLRLERFPSLRRRANPTPLDANRLAEELDSLVSFSEQRRQHHQTTSTASSATAAHVADSSREALYHWHPSDEPARAVQSFLYQQQETRRVGGEKRSADASSLYVESSSEEPESVKRIQNWRVNIQQAPSVLSKVASAHSRFHGQDDGVSSHLTSVSRSPLSKNSGEKATRGTRGEVDPQMTPTLKAKRITEAELDWDAIRQIEARCGVSVKSSDQQPQLGTHHIARLSDSQFDRLARATEASSPPPPAPIPCEPPLSISPSPSSRTSSHHHLHPAAPQNTPTHLSHTNISEDDRRTSLDASAAATTLSVLEKKASQHIDTLDKMIRRHPDKMYRIFKDRPGLMLVVLLRCKVEDRISEVQTNITPLMDLTASTPNGKEAQRDAISLIEESLIDLRFDDERDAAQPQLSTQQPSVEAHSTPSIVISQHHTGDLADGFLSHPIPSASTSTTFYPATTIVADDEGEVAHLGPRSEAALEGIIHRLEQAGELCSVQQTLLALQDRLMSTNADCGRMRERLSAVSSQKASEVDGMVD